MAGFGEACPHISAIFFVLDASTQVRKILSCTSVPCLWLPPNFKNDPFAQITDINFSVPTNKKKGERPESNEQTSSAILPLNARKELDSIKVSSFIPCTHVM